MLKDVERMFNYFISIHRSNINQDNAVSIANGKLSDIAKTMVKCQQNRSGTLSVAEYFHVAGARKTNVGCMCSIKSSVNKSMNNIKMNALITENFHLDGKNFSRFVNQLPSKFDCSNDVFLGDPYKLSWDFGDRVTCSQKTKNIYDSNAGPSNTRFSKTYFRIDGNFTHGLCFLSNESITNLNQKSNSKHVKPGHFEFLNNRDTMTLGRFISLALDWVLFCGPIEIIEKQLFRKHLSLLRLPLFFSFPRNHVNAKYKKVQSKYTNNYPKWQGHVFEEVTGNAYAQNIFSQITKNFCSKFPSFFFKKMTHSKLLSFASKGISRNREFAANLLDKYSLRLKAFRGNAVNLNKITRIVILSQFLFLCPFLPKVHADISDGLVGWWKLDEASGNAIDSSGYGNDGTPTGTTIESGCKRGNCRSFNGTTDLISVGGFSFSSTQVSIALWINVPGSTTASSFGLTSNLGGNVRFQAHMPYSDNILYWDFGNYLSNGRISTSIAAYLNKWTHIVLVSNGVNFKAIYINGVLVTSSGTADSVGTATSFTIGKWNFGAGYFFNGKMDDFRIYNRVLSLSEIYSIYSSATPKAIVKGGARITGLKVN